jgi:hypothetical protein
MDSMKDKVKRLKTLIKSGAKEKPTFGTDPNEPWSARAGITEDAMLVKFLISKGINPKYVSKDQKIAHSKTNEFLRWKQNHAFEEIQYEDVGHMATKGEGGKTQDRASDLKKTVTTYKQIKNPPGSMAALKKEDVYQDPQAATQTVFDGANNTNDVSERRKKLAKSARMIKSIYKKNKMVKEDLYDWEKEDKKSPSYGKKPKFDKEDDKASIGENKPKAAAVMSGGTTLTGKSRDTVEIDPMMRVRPGQPDPTKKDDKKDGKKKDDKKDK